MSFQVTFLTGVDCKDTVVREGGGGRGGGGEGGREGGREGNSYHYQSENFLG